MATIQTVLRRNNTATDRKKKIRLDWIIMGSAIFLVLLFVVGNYAGLRQVQNHAQQQREQQPVRPQPIEPNFNMVHGDRERASRTLKKYHSHHLDFREYPPHRYYQLGVSQKHQPNFLTHTAEYIYGQWPLVLIIHGVPHKLIVNQSAWESGTETLPFADGTNPSVLALDRLPSWDPTAALKKKFPNARYLATACMTNSQCSWRDSKAQKKLHHISMQEEPTTVRTILLILDETFQVLDETTVYLKRDGGWGRKLAQPNNKAHLPALDDARLFVHQNQLFVSYREGPGFGYETQVLNPIHIEFDGTKPRENGESAHFSARILASETSSFCCGRNMALIMESSDHLRALTWVDPVTTIDVDTTPGATNKEAKKRRLLESGHRRLGGKRGKKKEPHKSHIHGTNGFMVEWTSELYLGVAHFHRPSDRQKNPYARFGHHYTHAFYTVSRNTDQLVSLSPEFVLPSAHVPKDAEIIQFISGLEHHFGEGTDSHQFVLAYGINDCEAAAVIVLRRTIEELLRPVEAGKQVVDFMKKVKPSP